MLSLRGVLLRKDDVAIPVGTMRDCAIAIEIIFLSLDGRGQGEGET